MSAQPSTLRELVRDIFDGFAIYAPILIALEQGDGTSYDEVTGQTSVILNPLVWSDKFTHEYADESFVFVGKNDFQGGLDTPVRIGRSRECDVCLEQESVSKVHATIAFVRQKNGYFILDEASKNGTFVNGEQIVPKLRTELYSGSFVSFGDAVFVFLDPPSLRALARNYG